MNKKDFFDECANILGTQHNFVDLKPRRKTDRKTGKIIQTDSAYTRWGPRIPGNGRFPGFGLVRVFSPSNIFVVLQNPIQTSKSFNSYQETLDFLRQVVDNDK